MRRLDAHLNKLLKRKNETENQCQVTQKVEKIQGKEQQQTVTPIANNNQTLNTQSINQNTKLHPETSKFESSQKQKSINSNSISDQPKTVKLCKQTQTSGPIFKRQKNTPLSSILPKQQYEKLEKIGQKIKNKQKNNDVLQQYTEIVKIQYKNTQVKLQNQIQIKKSSKCNYIVRTELTQKQQEVFEQTQKNSKMLQMKCIKQLNQKILKNDMQIQLVQQKQRMRTKYFKPGDELPNSQDQKNFISKFKYSKGITPNKFLISAWNINGIKKAIEKRFIFGYLKLSKPDIFCVQEIRIDYDTFKECPITFEGFNAYWNFCKCSKGYSGVGVFTKFPPIRIIQDFPDRPQFSQQGRVLTLQYEKFYLVNAYMPAAGEFMQRLFYKVIEFQPIFYQFVDNLRKQKDVIIAGDMNVSRNQLDAYICKGIEQKQAYHPLQRKNIQKFLTQGWIDTFRLFHPRQRKFSWWNIQKTGRKKNMGKRIDYFIVNDKFLPFVEQSDVMSHIWGSDHAPIQLKVNFQLQASDNEEENMTQNIKTQTDFLNQQEEDFLKQQNDQSEYQQVIKIEEQLDHEAQNEQIFEI